MNRLTILVSPEGQWVFPGSTEFLEILGDPNPDYDAEAYAVKNMGFIKFSMIERAIVEIELHPTLVALPALLAVQQQLQTSGVTLFRLKYFTTVWESEITSSVEQAITRLSELCAPQFVAPDRERYLFEPKDYGQLLADEENPLRLMAQKWRAAFGKFDPTLIPFAISHNLLPQLLIIGIKPNASDPVFRFVGEAHASWLDQQYHLSVLGERVDNVPDKDYAGWAAEFYKNVASNGQPRFDCVTASIQGRQSPYLTRYERLVLPWRTDTGEILLTVSPRRLASAAAPLPAAGPPANPPARKPERSS
ncbi:MAG TPA: hypothetical protein VHY35_22430 [Stellaceae bacterium]|nr:hypothetical protein [Stellaceae bacterium]